MCTLTVDLGCQNQTSITQDEAVPRYLRLRAPDRHARRLPQLVPWLRAEPYRHHALRWHRSRHLRGTSQLTSIVSF